MDNPCDECPINIWNVQKTQIIIRLESEIERLKKQVSELLDWNADDR